MTSSQTFPNPLPFLVFTNADKLFSEAMQRILIIYLKLLLLGSKKSDTTCINYFGSSFCESKLIACTTSVFAGTLFIHVT